MIRPARLPIETLGPFGFTAIMVVMGFNSSLDHPWTHQFGKFLLEGSVIGFFSTLIPLVAILFIFRNPNKVRPQTTVAREKQGREHRLQVGYLRVAWDIFRFDCLVCVFGMAQRIFLHPPETNYSVAQLLTVGLVCALLATGVHVIYLKLSDRLVLDPPGSHLSALDQLLWLFKGNT